MPTPLDDNPQLRRFVYALLFFGSIGLGGVQAFYAAYADGAQHIVAPWWLHGAMAVWMSVSTAVGYIAWSNTPSGGTPKDKP